MTIYELQNKLHNRILDGRSMEVLLETPLFDKLYTSSTKQEHEDLQDILMRMSKSALKSWMDNHSALSLDDMTKDKLQSRAFQHGVPYYSSLNKAQLVKALTKIEEAKNEKSRNDK